MKKIGVITHWGSLDNYGQTLQAYALQRAIESFGFAPFLIRYIEDGIKRSIFRKALSALNPIFLFNYLRFKKLNKEDYINNLNHGRDLRKFLDEHVTQASQIYSRKELITNPPYADIFITGSDQVWNKLDKSYFLDFIDNKKKIAYAASFGATRYNEKERQIIYDLLKSFDSITVREYTGKVMCEEMGLLNIDVVPDPTILLERDTYMRLAKTISSDKSYLLIYLLGNETDFKIRECYRFANEHNLDVKYIAGQRQSDKYPKIYPSLEEWIGCIANAKYVITNSFHGTVMSAILNTQFISIPLTGKSSRMNSRIETLLNELDLLDRMSSNLSLLHLPIDFLTVNSRLERLRRFGIERLNTMILDK